jgi:hypothetical protein
MDPQGFAASKVPVDHMKHATLKYFMLRVQEIC